MNNIAPVIHKARDLRSGGNLFRCLFQQGAYIALFCGLAAISSGADNGIMSAKGEISTVTAAIIDADANPYPTFARTDLSVSVGGGQGVLISPHWVMTASHCVSSRREGRVPVIYTDSTGKKRRIMSDMVIRSGSTDIALVRLTESAPNRIPLLLLKDGLGEGENGKVYLLKKVTINNSWDKIPASVSKKSEGKRFYVSKENRKGKAGTSGSPWVIESEWFGDVLVGITHGTGRVPQVGKIWKWISETVTENSEDQLHWITPQQALKKRDNIATEPRAIPKD